MKTDLANLFQKLAEPDYEGQYNPAHSGNLCGSGYSLLENALETSEAIRLHCLVLRPQNLINASAIGLILSDVVVLSGLLDFEADGEDSWPASHRMRFAHMGQNPEFEENSENIRLLKASKVPTRINEKLTRFTFGMFGSDDLEIWAKEAKPFIEDGQLIYLPQRLITLLDNQYFPVSVKTNLAWSTWSSSKIDEEADETKFPIPNVSLLKSVPSVYKAFEIALPYIRGLPLSTLYQVLKDETDSLVLFRQAITNAMSTYSQEIQNIEMGEIRKVITIGQKLRMDIIDPELSKLSKRFKRISQIRAIKIAGATIGTISLMAASLMNGGLPSAITSTMSAGGIGLIAKEFAESRSDILSAKESPWYLAWRLRNLTKP